MNLIEVKGKDLLSFLNDQCTIDLAFYELGNATWKSIHRKLISPDLGKKMGQNLQTILQSLQIIRFDVEDYEKALDFAVQMNLTHYDAFYLFTAKNHSLTLVTDDLQLLTTAKKRKIPCISTQDFIFSNRI